MTGQGTDRSTFQPKKKEPPAFVQLDHARWCRQWMVSIFSFFYSILTYIRFTHIYIFADAYSAPFISITRRVSFVTNYSSEKAADRPFSLFVWPKCIILHVQVSDWWEWSEWVSEWMSERVSERHRVVDYLFFPFRVFALPRFLSFGVVAFKCSQAEFKYKRARVEHYILLVRIRSMIAWSSVWFGFGLIKPTRPFWHQTNQRCRVSIH